MKLPEIFNDNPLAQQLWGKIPEHNHYGLAMYIEHGVEPGSFLKAVISNDLKESFARADEVNREHIFDIVNFMYNIFPAGTWGSANNFKEHLR